MFSKTSKIDAANANAGATKKTVPTIIANGLHILGNVIGEGVMDIDGSIDGNIKTEQVTVRGSGKVRGDIVAGTVHVYGEVYGLIRAQAVHLYSSCHVEGIIMHQSLTVEDGAFIDGKFKRFHGQSLHTEELHDEMDENIAGIIEDKPMAAANNLRLVLERNR